MDPRKLSTEELVRLCLETRDEDLCTEFVRRFQPVIARTVRRRIAHYTRWIDRDRVDDLVQDTFLKICEDDFRRLRKFEFREQGEKGLYAFLKVMAAHMVEDDIRQNNSGKKGGGQKLDNIDDLSQPVSDRSSAVESIFNNLRMSEIEICLQRRKGEPNFDRDCKVFWLHNRDGVTAQEISQLPDIGFNTVKGVESALLRLNRWVLQCVQGGKAKKS